MAPKRRTTARNRMCKLPSAALLCLASTAEARLTDYVDPLIGTVGSTPGSAIAGGNSFPGASLPWGMVKAGIDTSYLGLPNGTAVDCNAGYSPLGNMTALSLTHVSGSGGVPTYGLISQMPLSGMLGSVNLGDNSTYWQNRSLDLETSSVGLFTTTLLNGVKIEITSSNHSAFIRYTFPGDSETPKLNSTVAASETLDLPGNSNVGMTSSDAHVLVDLTHVLPGYSTQTYSQKFLGGNLHVRSSAGQLSYFGTATYTGGWPQPDTHTLHFCSNFSVPSSSSLLPTDSYIAEGPGGSATGAGTLSWPYDPVLPPAFSARPTVRSYSDVKASSGNGLGLGALFSWTPSGTNSSSPLVLEAKIGISYISPEKACSHVAKELPTSTFFEQVVEQARGEWEDKVLSKIEIVDDGSDTSKNDTLKRMLYSALYQTGLMPTDKTGEIVRWESNETVPYYDDHYTLWDTYRTLLPLYHLLFTSTYSRVIKGLINIFTYEGFLPTGRAANWNGRVQGGTHAEIVLADAFVKSAVAPSGQEGRGELGNIDWEESYAAMVKDANILPERNVDSAAFDGATKEGRGALDEYLRLHFITRNHTRSISRGVEYSQNDFAIWSVVQGLNKSSEEVAHYLGRAGWWTNQWNPTANTTLDEAGSFTGFPGARNADGSWNFTSYDPLSCGGCGWGDDIYEAKVWETAFSAAPYDMSKVIELMGGDDAFIKRLDASFLPGYGTSVGANNDAGSALFNPGNEPSFAIPFLYNYVPKHHWKTVNQTRSTVDEFYSDARNGYPGNIDGGALPSWLIFNLIGLYPVAGQPLYLLGAPRFTLLKLNLFTGTGQANTLVIRAKNLSDTIYYPQSVSLNGNSMNRSWLSHAELIEGGELVFNMGDTPGSWDGGDRPYSLSSW